MNTLAVKKLAVSVLIVGTFILYALLHNSRSSAGVPVALVPTTPANPSAAADTPAATDTSAGNATAAPSPTDTPSTRYKNGTYTGGVADAQWGLVQVKAIIKNGKIADVQWVQYPSDRERSVFINSYADPQLTQEAIQAQSAQVDIVTGATDSSFAFMQSLTDALSQAQA
jgi:uncharacterized protein with FMN-binding domain